MNSPLAVPCRLRWGLSIGASTAMLALVVALATFAALALSSVHATKNSAGLTSPGLARLAATHPHRAVEAIVQFRTGVGSDPARDVAVAHGGRVTRDLPIINALGVRTTAADAAALARDERVRVVSLNGTVKTNGYDTSHLATAYEQSIKATNVWNGAGARGSRGAGVGVAVIDTGIQGDLPDFRVSKTDARSRVIASAVVNPSATTAGDKYGHGTHVAGLIGGNGLNRPTSDPLYGKYIGVAPDANLISVKASDDAGNVSTLDVIDGLQFVVDHKADYKIKVVNLSLNAETAQSYKIDPLDAAVEQAWNAGIVVVAAAGNRGTAADAVNYAPANDPFVITVGGVDDRGTVDIADDQAASWSSTGKTQDGFQKPDFLAPGAHMMSTISQGSLITKECPGCVGDSAYFRMGGTSMATGVVSGAVALALANYSWTPNQVKSAFMSTLREVPGVGSELDVAAMWNARGALLSKPNSYAPNTYINSATGQVDFSKSRWSKSRWSTASAPLNAGWSKSSWSCSSCGAGSGTVSTSRSSWSKSRWSMSFTK